MTRAYQVAFCNAGNTLRHGLDMTATDLRQWHCHKWQQKPSSLGENLWGEMGNGAMLTAGN
eukprot:6482873-Amphidinium_carterae.1